MSQDQNDALKSAGAWLERWATHVGNCKGDPWCSCGLTAITHEVTVAMEDRAEGAPAAEAWRPEVRAFADLMEAQLRANDHKPGWKDDTDLDLFERLGQESAELLAALRRNAKRLMWGDSWVMEDTVPRVGAEAADVANFAMMIADVCGALKLKENGLSREELGGSARASRGAAGPSDCAEGVPPLSDGGRGQ